MKITVSTKDLAVAAAKCYSFVPQKPAEPIDAYIALVAEDNQLKITTTGKNSKYAQVTIPAQIKEAGTTAIQAEYLNRYLSVVNATDIHISTCQYNNADAVSFQSNFDEKRKKFNSTRIFCALPAKDLGDFVFPEFATKGKKITLPTNLIKDMLKSVIFANQETNIENIKANSGIEICLMSKRILARATDSAVFSENECNIASQIKNPISFVLPRADIDALLKSLVDNSEIVFSIGSESIILEFLINDKTNIKIYASTLQSKIPALSTFLDNFTAKTTITVNAKDLFKSLDRMQLLRPSAQNDRFVNFSITDEGLNISAIKTDADSASENLSATVTGEDFFASPFLAPLFDFCKNCTGPKDIVQISFDQPNRFAVVKNLAKKNQTTIIPLALSEFMYKHYPLLDLQRQIAQVGSQIISIQKNIQSTHKEQLAANVELGFLQHIMDFTQSGVKIAVAEFIEMPKATDNDAKNLKKIKDSAAQINEKYQKTVNKIQDLGNQLESQKISIAEKQAQIKDLQAQLAELQAA